MLEGPLHLIGPYLDGLDEDDIVGMLEEFEIYLRKRLAFDLYYEETWMSKRPGAKIAGADYHAVDDNDIDDNLSDLSTPVVVEDGSGYAAGNDLTR